VNQTLALLLDAYRELNAKRLFWITLIFSGVFIGAFALIGYNDSGLKVAGYQIDMIGSESLYKPLFSQIVIGFWLSWVATILALISTAGMFPDLLVSGSIDLYLARPMSRLRLFLTKYFCGLLFVAIQVGLIALGGFLVMGLRAGQWEPSLFLAIPLVVLMFSYVFAVCVLLGVWTRSTIASLLLALAVWGSFSFAQFTENMMLQWQRYTERRVLDAQRTIRNAKADLADDAAHPSSDIMGVPSHLAKVRLESAQAELPQLEHDTHLPKLLHKISVVIWFIVPKTRETTDLLDRWLLSDEEATGRMQRREERFADEGRTRQEEQMDAAIDVAESQRHRSTFWIIGTSLGDEAIFVGIAAWLFCRRDY
jgi:hypothetical protein